MYHKRQGESKIEYIERLFLNRSDYNLTWEDVAKLLGLDYSGDHIRKMSYGFLKRRELETTIDYDKSIMIINDLHLPYEREDIWEIIRKHKHEITTLVIAGDLMDCYSISSFPKIESITVEEEMIYTHDFLTKLRRELPESVDIIIFNGNHEERWQREIARMQPKGLQKILNPNILSTIIEGFKLYYDGSNGEESKIVTKQAIEGITYIPHWYINIDKKLVVAHPKGYSQVDGRMCENVVAHFVNREEEFDAVVFGHTHKYSQMVVSRRGGKYAVENGCLCKNMTYADSGRLTYTPQDYAYTIVKYNDNEPIDYNNIEVYLLDEIYERADVHIEL